MFDRLTHYKRDAPARCVGYSMKKECDEFFLNNWKKKEHMPAIIQNKNRNQIGSE